MVSAFGLTVMILQAAGIAGTTLTKGGTLSGDFVSDAASPAVRIATSEPVLLHDMVLTGEGPFIVTTVDHAKIKLLRIRVHGHFSDRAGAGVGRFIALENPDSIEISECELDRTAGIYIAGFGVASQGARTIYIHDNIVNDIDGRVGNRVEAVQFVQLDKVRHVGGIEIAWNQVINQPGQSAVEDNISIFKSSGLPESPIRIHDNYIRGAYPLNPARGMYSGGGLMLGDGAEPNPDDGPCYVEAFENQVVDTTNYGIAISAGHNIAFHDNRIVSSGLLPGRLHPRAQNVGVYVWNINRDKIPRANFHDNGGMGNIVGWNKGAARNDWWTPDADVWQNNIHLTGPVTALTVAQEWNIWQKKLAAHLAATHS